MELTFQLFSPKKKNFSIVRTLFLNPKKIKINKNKSLGEGILLWKRDFFFVNSIVGGGNLNITCFP